MTSRTSDFAVAAIVGSLAALASLPACGSSDAPRSGQQSPCEARDGLVCAPPGFPFVVSAVAVTDYCLTDPNKPSSCPATTIPPAGRTTARLTEPAAGTLCMAGTVPADGWAVLALRFFDTLNLDGTFVTSFHPVRTGITALGVTIDSPPSGGVKLSRIGGYLFGLTSNPDVPLVVTAPVSLILPLSNFVLEGSNPPVTSPPDDVQTLGFNIYAGDYDFCVHDFKMLDASGNQVAP